MHWPLRAVKALMDLTQKPGRHPSKGLAKVLHQGTAHYAGNNLVPLCSRTQEASGRCLVLSGALRHRALNIFPPTRG